MPKFRSDHIARAGLLLVFTTLAALTWRKWGYLPVDVGREMYIPAAMVEGKRLYFDLWYVYGPLIPYWHAMLFRVFGIHLGVLFGVGLSVVAIIAATLYSISRVFLPVSLSFAAVFAFLMQAFQLNIFNYVLPYSYPAAYGAMFSVLMVWLLLGYLNRPGLRYLPPAAFLASLMMLTKLEFGAAGYAVLGSAVAIQAVRARSLRVLAEGVAVCVPGLLVWLGIYGWYVHAGGAEFFLGENLSMLPSSHFVQHFRATWNEFTGLVLDPFTLAVTALVGLSGFAILAGGTVMSARSRVARWLLPAVALVFCALPVMLPKSEAANGTARFLFFNPGMVFVCGAVLVTAIAAWWRDRERTLEASTIVLCAMAILSGARVLTKIAPSGYPVFFDTLIYPVLLVGLYRVSERFSAGLEGFSGRALAGILCLSLVAVTYQNYPVGQRPAPVSSERGMLYTEAPFGENFSEVLAFLKSLKKTERFVLLPEDTALYYFSGTTAPSRWYVVIPPDLPPGKATADYVNELERANLKYVILSNRATPEYKLPLFGIDYGQPILAWVKEHYEVVRTIGDYEPVAHPRGWGVLIYQRKGTAEQAAATN